MTAAFLLAGCGSARDFAPLATHPASSSASPVPQLRFIARRMTVLGRGNTAGDTVIYLPAEKILCAGDLLDHPVPYLYGGIPTEQAATLTKMAELDATTIVPGHGDVLRDKTYISLVIDLLNAVNASVEKALNHGKTLEEAMELVPKDVDEPTWRKKFVGSDAEEGDAFDGTFSSVVKNTYNLVKAR